MSSHAGGNATCDELAVCDICKQEYGWYFADVHDDAKTEIRNDKEATAEEPGYTGDKYCADCGALLELGKEIPATEPGKEHTHDFSGGWKYDSKKHYQECAECGNWSGEGDHNYVNGICTVCKAPMPGYVPPATAEPTTPPTKPENPPAKTGDTAALALWISLLTLSTCGVAVVFLANKRKSGSK